MVTHLGRANSGTRIQVLSCLVQRSIHTALPGDEILQSQETQPRVPLPAGGLQLATAFTITQLLVTLAASGSKGLSPETSQTLHESEPGGSD